MFQWLVNNYNYFAHNYNFTNFKEFLVSNGIIGTAAGVIIAYAAWDLIKSLIGELILPGFYFLFIHPFIEDGSKVSLFFEPIEKINLPNVFKNVLSFFIMLVITFFIIHYITMHWISLTSNEGSNFMKPTVGGGGDGGGGGEEKVAVSAATPVAPATPPVSVSPMTPFAVNMGNPVAITNAFPRTMQNNVYRATVLPRPVGSPVTE